MSNTAETFARRSLISIDRLNRLEALDIIAAGARELSAPPTTKPLKGRTVCLAFFEDSTRTRTSFELAAKRLGGDVVTITNSGSSASKGESFYDTIQTLAAMGVDLFIVRHRAAGAAQAVADATGAMVVNAGDGMHQHPTQALLDALTLTQHWGSVEGKTIAICGDIAHSRVARSNSILLQMLGARVRVAAPPTLAPRDLESWGVTPCASARLAAVGADAVMALRLQHERMRGADLPSGRDYRQNFGVTLDVMAAAKPGALVLHPGPVNRGVEIDDAVVDHPDISLITNQVEAGVALRTGVLRLMAERADVQAPLTTGEPPEATPETTLGKSNAKAKAKELSRSTRISAADAA